MKKGEDDWEECIICMEPTNFDCGAAKYWVCCGQRMCSKCDDNQLLTSSGKERNCPFCSTPQMYSNETKFQSQLLMCHNIC